MPRKKSAGEACRNQEPRAVAYHRNGLAGTVNLLKRWVATTETSRAEMRQKARNCFTAHFEIERATDSLLAVVANPRSTHS